MKNPGFWAVNACLFAGILLAGCGEKDKPEQNSGQIVKSVQTEADAGSKITKPEASTKAAANIDGHPGKTLHDSNCISCHDSAIYAREDRKIADFPQLLAQVKRCNANLGARFSDDEIAQVTDYLNQAYYQYAR